MISRLWYLLQQILTIIGSFQVCSNPTRPALLRALHVEVPLFVEGVRAADFVQRVQLDRHFVDAPREFASGHLRGNAGPQIFAAVHRLPANHSSFHLWHSGEHSWGLVFSYSPCVAEQPVIIWPKFQLPCWLLAFHVKNGDSRIVQINKEHRNASRLVHLLGCWHFNFSYVDNADDFPNND